LSSPYLSIIIPAHNEEHRLPPSLDKIDQFLKGQSYTAEIIVVENGSTDGTYQTALNLTANIPNLRVFKEERRGKGLAVQRGMLEALGEYRFICDADLSMPIEQVARFLPPNLKEIDIAIGSREAKGSKRYNEPEYRHIIGRMFNWLVQIFALPGLQDSQCGFKIFRGDVAKELFPKQTLTGMSFDVEVLFIARRMGYEIKEIPIDWYFDPDSRVRLVHDSLRMFFDLITIRKNALQGAYGEKVRHHRTA
jgi:dolichyl-phosphate beta-glucosyltransferase